MTRVGKTSAVLLLLGMAAASSDVRAAECVKQEKTASEMSESTYTTAQAAMELLSKQKTAEAIEKLNKIAENGSDYEKAIVNYNLGVAFSSKNDYASAVRYFSKALSTNALPQTQREQLQFNLGQLYIVAGQFDDGIKTLQDYISRACGTVSAEAHIFLANALSDRKRYADALPQIDL